MTEDNQDKALKLAIASIDSQFGKGSVMRLGDDDVEPWPSIPTGAFSLDRALGIGGLPRGRVVEVYGPESSGKTTLTLSVVAQAQALGERCAFIDVEHALDRAYAKALGVRLNDLYLSQPDYGEAALEIVSRLVNTGSFAVVVLDSVASLLPKAELDGEMGSAHVGLLPRLMSQAMRKLPSAVHKANTLLIFTNQLREKVGVMYGNPEVQPGGRALKFNASVRIDIRRKEDIKDAGGELVGVRTRAKIVKNKLAPPLQVCEFDIIYGYGIDAVGSLFDVGVKENVFVQTGGWVYYEGESYAHGRAKAVELLRADPELQAKIGRL